MQGSAIRIEKEMITDGKAINKMKNGKALGGGVLEMLKAGGDACIDIVADL